MPPTEIPIHLLRFPMRAILRRRRLAAHGYSINAARVVAGTLVLDFSQIEDGRGTIGLVDLAVTAGCLEVVVRRGHQAHVNVRTRLGGKVDSRVGNDRQRPHLLIAGTVTFGRLIVREVDDSSVVPRGQQPGP